MAAKSAHFSPRLFAFLRELAENNQRDWFLANKARYEDEVQHPARRFISDFGPRLEKISPHFTADPRPNKGSLFRIYRDVRFSRDKSPYKHYAGIRFPHRKRREVHAPGFYLHLEPGGCFAGVGAWRPERDSLAAIRREIDEHRERWRKVVEDDRFRRRFERTGETLKRAPKGYSPDHPLIEDLKRKDFIGIAHLDEDEVTAPGFLDRYFGLCRAGSGYVELLCRAIGVPF